MDAAIFLSTTLAATKFSWLPSEALFCSAVNASTRAFASQFEADDLAKRLAILASSLVGGTIISSILAKPLSSRLGVFITPALAAKVAAFNCLAKVALEAIYTLTESLYQGKQPQQSLSDPPPKKDPPPLDTVTADDPTQHYAYYSKHPEKINDLSLNEQAILSGLFAKHGTEHLIRSPSREELSSLTPPALKVFATQFKQHPELWEAYDDQVAFNQALEAEKIPPLSVSRGWKGTMKAVALIALLAFGAVVGMRSPPQPEGPPKSTALVPVGEVKNHQLNEIFDARPLRGLRWGITPFNAETHIRALLRASGRRDPSLPDVLYGDAKEIYKELTPPVVPQPKKKTGPEASGQKHEWMEVGPHTTWKEAQPIFRAIHQDHMCIGDWIAKPQEATWHQPLTGAIQALWNLDKTPEERAYETYASPENDLTAKLHIWKHYTHETLYPEDMSPLFMACMKKAHMDQVTSVDSKTASYNTITCLKPHVDSQKPKIVQANTFSLYTFVGLIASVALSSLLTLATYFRRRSKQSPPLLPAPSGKLPVHHQHKGPEYEIKMEEDAIDTPRTPFDDWDQRSVMNVSLDHHVSGTFAVSEDIFQQDGVQLFIDEKPCTTRKRSGKQKENFKLFLTDINRSMASVTGSTGWTNTSKLIHYMAMDLIPTYYSTTSKDMTLQKISYTRESVTLDLSARYRDVDSVHASIQFASLYDLANLNPSSITID